MRYLFRFVFLSICLTFFLSDFRVSYAGIGHSKRDKISPKSEIKVGEKVIYEGEFWTVSEIRDDVLRLTEKNGNAERLIGLNERRHIYRSVERIGNGFKKGFKKGEYLLVIEKADRTREVFKIVDLFGRRFIYASHRVSGKMECFDLQDQSRRDERFFYEEITMDHLSKGDDVFAEISNPDGVLNLNPRKFLISLQTDMLKLFLRTTQKSFVTF